MRMSFVAAGSAFLAAYFNIFAAFLPGGVGTGAEIFVGTIVGTILENMIFRDNISNAEGLQLAVYAMIGSVLGSFVGGYLGFSPKLSGALAGGLTVLFAAQLVGPLTGIFGKI